jgi:hypothetical protein
MDSCINRLNDDLKVQLYGYIIQPVKLTISVEHKVKCTPSDFILRAKKARLVQVFFEKVRFERFEWVL